MLGIQEIVEEFSTKMQFSLEDIRGVEDIMKERNMSLELGVFSLGRIMEKAKQALRSQSTNINSDTAASLLKPPGKNMFEEAIPEGVTLKSMNTNEGIE